MLRGRTAECAALDELLRAVRTGESGTLVLRGEAGIGKSALLDYAAAHAEGCEVVRATGVESEMELPFATLHQPCLPLLERVDRLPAPQAAALRTAFGLSSEVGVNDGRKIDAMKERGLRSSWVPGGCSGVLMSQ
jgi:hypothetical protein